MIKYALMDFMDEHNRLHSSSNDYIINSNFQIVLFVDKTKARSGYPARALLIFEP